jgi:hypothetical protein
MSSRKSCISKPSKPDITIMPNQFSDFIAGNNCRFSEICRIYLHGLTIDDLKYMKPEDLINTVPPEHYKHRLLMSILVRRYLYKCFNNTCSNTCNNSCNNSCCSTDNCNNTSNNTSNNNCNNTSNNNCNSSDETSDRC